MDSSRWKSDVDGRRDHRGGIGRRTERHCDGRRRRVGGVGSAAAVLAGELATTRFVVQRVLMPAVIVFGVLANSVNIAVLTLRVVRGSVLRDPIQPNPSSD